ncbi:MAG: mechanosensitive ion channel family protein [Desulfobulbaceae bacterium]|nr:MAG: mechanosensitive ion channel family protein [Desulfobulbaceae bacterium]
MFELDSKMITDLAILWGSRIGAALLVLLVGRWLSGMIAKFVIKILEKYEVDVTLTKFLYNIIYYALLAAVVVAAAGQLGINTTSFLTIIGAAGLAVGLALKDSLSNFASGVMLILFRPFKVGDFVNAAGVSGTVEEITVFNTVFKTPDNQRVIIPNGKISNDTITNVNANPTRRIDLVVGVGYDDDLKKTRSVLEEIVAAEPRILKEPAVTIAVSELADSSVNFVLRPWVNTDDYWATRFDLTEKIKLSLDEAGISIPYPQSDVHLYQEQK